MHIFVGRPRLTLNVARVLYFGTFIVALTAFVTVAQRYRRTDADRYREFQHQLYAWDSTMITDTFRLRTLAYSPDTNQPDLRHELTRVRDHLARATRERQKVANDLVTWLRANDPAPRDTLDVLRLHR